MKKLILSSVVLINLVGVAVSANPLINRIGKISANIRMINKIDVDSSIVRFNRAIIKTKKEADLEVRIGKHWNDGFARSEVSFIQTLMQDGSTLDVSVLTQIMKSPIKGKRGGGEVTGISILTNTKDEAILNDIIDTLGGNGRTINAVKIKRPDGSALEEYKMINIPLELNDLNRININGRVESLISKLNRKSLGSQDQTKLTRARITTRSSK